MAARGELGGGSSRGEQESASGARSKELKAKREKNLMEYIDVTINNLKHQIMTDFQEEKSRKNFRLNEITHLIQHHKDLNNEHIV